MKKFFLLLLLFLELSFFNMSLVASTKEKDRKKIVLPTLSFNATQNLVIAGGLITATALLVYFLNQRKNKNVETEHITQEVDNNIKQLGDNLVKKIEEENVNKIDTIEILAKKVQTAVQNCNVTALKELAKNTNFENACKAKINGKNVGDLILELEYAQLCHTDFPEIIERLDIEEKLLNDLIVYSFDKQAYACLNAFLKKLNTFKENQCINTIQNQIIFKEMIDLYKQNPTEQNNIILECVANFCRQNIEINSDMFKELNTIFEKNSMIKFNFLYHYYLKRNDWKVLYDILVESGTIIKKDASDSASQLQQLLDSVIFDPFAGDLIKKELKEEHIKNGQCLFDLIMKKNQIQDAEKEFVDCIKNLKNRGIHPLEIIEKETGRTVLHYIFLRKEFCTNEMLKLIFYQNNDNIFEWHNNITLVDNTENKKIFLDFVESPTSVIKFLAKFDDQYACEIKQLLERNHTENEKVFEYLLRSSQQDNLLEHINNLYLLFSYGIKINNPELLYTRHHSWTNLSCHIRSFNRLCTKMDTSTKNICMKFVQDELKNLNKDFFDKDNNFCGHILNSIEVFLQCSEAIAKEFLQIIFEKMLTNENEKLVDILKHFIEYKIKNTSILFDLFEKFFFENQKGTLFGFAREQENNEMVKKLLSVQNEDCSFVKNIYEKYTKECTETEFESLFYIDLLEKSILEDGPFPSIIRSKTEELIKLAEKNRFPVLFTELLTFGKKIIQTNEKDLNGQCIKQKILDAIYSDFNIIKLLEDNKTNNDKFSKKIKQLCEKEFILCIKNQLSFFDLHAAEEYLEKYYVPVIDTKQKNFLHIAMLEDNKTIIDWLIKYHSHLVLQRDELGNTPLHYAKNLSVLITIGYDAYLKNPKIFDLRNWFGQTPFQCFFEQLDKEKFEEIFFEQAPLLDKKPIKDIFKSIIFNNDKYKSAIWLAFFKSMDVLDKFRLGFDLEFLCENNIKYVDFPGIIYVFDSRDNHAFSEYFLKPMKEKQSLSCLKKSELIQFCLNNKDEKYIHMILKNSEFFIDQCIAISSCKKIDEKNNLITSYFDLICRSAKTGFHTKKLFEKFQRNISDEWKNGGKVATLMNGLIGEKLTEKEGVAVFKIIFENDQQFPLKEKCAKYSCQYAVEMNKFEIADLFSMKFFDVHCIEKSITERNKNTEKYVLKHIEKTSKEIVKSHKNHNDDTILHLYNVPITFFEKKKNLLLTFLEDYNFNFLAKNKQGIPAIMKLCVNVDYRHFIDWWVSNKIKNDKDLFIKKLQNDRVTTYQNNNKISKKSILFYFSTLCRLKRTVKNIGKEMQDQIGVDINNLFSSQTKDRALWYCVNFIGNFAQEKDNLGYELYKYVENDHMPNITKAIEKKKVSSSDDLLLRDPLFRITAGKNAAIFNDSQKDFLSNFENTLIKYYDELIESNDTKKN